MRDKPEFWRYCDYKVDNYGIHALAFQDAEGNIFYFSYDTLVAFYSVKLGKTYIRENDWSTTTGKHLNAIDPDKSKRIPENAFNVAYDLAFSKELVEA